MFNNGYAVVIGVGGDLPNTVDDAEGLANILVDPSRCAYLPSHVQLLTGERAKKADILKALDTLDHQTQKNSDAVAMIFFSGHGLELPSYHLMPYGYDINDLHQTAIAGSDFSLKISQISAKKLIIILDCCHAGGMVDVTGNQVKKSPMPNELLNMLKSGSGRVLLASSRRDEVSYAGAPYSEFTAALLEGFAGYGSSELDGYARVLDIAIWTGRMVPNRTNDKQHPIIKVSNLENNFPVSYYSSGQKEVKPLDWTTKIDFLSKIQFDNPRLTNLKIKLSNYYENLALIEERMSEYVEYVEIPLQLIKSKKYIVNQINNAEHEIQSLMNK